jgi:hypothetical protein
MTDRLLVLATVGFGSCLALPHSDGQSLYSRQSTTSGGGVAPVPDNQSGFSMQVWVWIPSLARARSPPLTPPVQLPVVIIALLGFVLVVSVCHKRSRRNAAAALEDRDNPTQQTTQAANGTTPGRTRRSRRPRRTPSQISTISLPAYMKEPGDEELVVYRSVLLHFKGHCLSYLSRGCQGCLGYGGRPARRTFFGGHS